jgi:protein O-mannosyl-transferase
MGRRRRSSDDPPARVTSRRMRWALAIVVAVVTVATFLPALQNGFLTWDDDRNFVSNVHYRGLGWVQLEWMWTTSHMGHYIPLTWMTFGLDYVLWGMEPAGYHLTSVLIHAVTAVLAFFLIVRLLSLSLPIETRDQRALAVSAAVGALVFAVHPLRVESVAWVTERRDVLCGLFCLATLLAYLRACARADAERRWYRAAVALYACALLSKSIAVPLCIVLLILDAYPLRRIGAAVGWWSTDARRVYAEKIPFVLLASATSVAAFAALFTLDNAATLAEVGVADRLALSAFGLAFYLWKTLVPVRLSPLYEAQGLVWASALSAGVVVAITALAVALRRRCPALLAVWVANIVMLLPVLGIFQNGPQIAADRYTYLAMLPWAVLGSAALWLGWRKTQEAPLRGSVIAIAVVAVVALLGALAWKQMHVWRDSETLWRHVVALAPGSAVGHSNLGAVLEHDGNITGAIQEFQTALRINPRFAAPHRHWGNALVRQGRFAEAVQQYVEALRIDPDDADAHNNLGAALIRHAEPAEVLKSYFQLMAAISYGSETGHVPDVQADLAQAIEHFQQALRIRPDYAAAHTNWGLALSQQGREHEANEHFEEARRLAAATPAPIRPWRRVGKAKQRRLPQLKPGIAPSARWDAVPVLASRLDADDDHRRKLAEAGVARRARAALGALARTG